MDTIVGARLKPLGGATEFVFLEGRIRSLITQYDGDNFDFVISKNRVKKVITFGVDNIDQELVGKTLPIVNKRFYAKFFEDGKIQVVEGPISEKNESFRIKRYDDMIIKESLPHQKSIDQLKSLRSKTKGIDIGDRIPNMKKQGANIHFMHNPIDNGVESYEDFEKNNKGFIPSWNTTHKMGPFDGRKSS